MHSHRTAHANDRAQKLQKKNKISVSKEFNSLEYVYQNCEAVSFEISLGQIEIQCMQLQTEGELSTFSLGKKTAFGDIH